MSCSRILVASFALTVLAGYSYGQITAYGVNSDGLLFRFDTANPSAVTEIGFIGFTPEGIDFRPGTNTLFAIDVGPNTTQLYTLNINNAMPTAVGSGFSSAGVNYSLTGNQSFGFDFNPKTLQADDSMRIRLVGTNATNLRLHSATGQIAAVDGSLAFANGSVPFVDGSAYINNIPEMVGTTALYDLDSRNDALLLQSPPNNGTVSTVGPLGVTVDALVGIGFDVYTTPGDIDPTIGGDRAFAVLKRPDAPIGGPLGEYLLYDVNLGTGTISNGALVGSPALPYEFIGGFAVVPEPASGTLLVLAIAVASRKARIIFRC